jgi:hypothetical protein
MRPQFGGSGWSWGLRYRVVAGAVSGGVRKLRKQVTSLPIDAPSPVGCVTERRRPG